jgi:hypothetical protein
MRDPRANSTISHGERLGNWGLKDRNARRRTARVDLRQAHCRMPTCPKGRIPLAALPTCPLLPR